MAAALFGPVAVARAQCPTCRSSTRNALEANSSTAAPKLTPASEPQRDWYGYQTLIADGLACSLLVYGVASSTDAMYWGYAAFLLGAPIVHLAHELPVPLLASLALRVLVPFTFLGLMVLTTSGFAHGDDHSDPGAAATLGAIGFAIPVALDAAFLAWEDRPADSIALKFSVDPRASAILVGAQGVW